MNTSRMQFIDLFSLKPLWWGFAACVMLSSSACMQQTSVPVFQSSQDLPSVAAEYQSISQHMQRRSQQTWRLWRQPQHLIHEHLDSQLTDDWQQAQDGRQLTLKKYFHAEQYGVVFYDDDLRMLNRIPHWPSSQVMLDLSILESLTLVKSAWKDAVPMQFYQGELEGVQWRIHLRTDLMLPVLIEYKNPSEQKSIRLLAAYPIQQAPWKPRSVANFQLIDFADFGDRNNDPVVKRIEGLLGLGHAIGHQHTH